MRRVLIISPHFPPTNAPDHQRVRMSLPHFRECGWDPTVLAVDADHVEAPRDPLLTASFPGDIAVHRVGALPARLTRLVGLGNIGYRAWSALQREGNRLLTGKNFDLIYFSTTQFVVTALGPKWRERHGVPYVVDLQDPWRTDYYERPGAPRPPGGWKYRFARWQAARLEEPSWRDAAGFISVSDRYLEDLRERYPWFAAKPAAMIPFGASERDFECVRADASVLPAFTREPGAIHLVSVGAVGPIMHDALDALFSRVRKLRDADPAFADRLRFHFVGTSYAAKNAALSVVPLAEKHGVADLVREQTSRVGYFVALKTLLAADAIVICGSNDPAYNPSRLANCFLAGRPTLVLASPDSVLHRAADELGFATLIEIPPQGDSPKIENFLQTLGRDPVPRPSGNTELFQATHTARARTEQQCALFAHALNHAEH